jgi:hypothetical protein
MPLDAVFLEEHNSCACGDLHRKGKTSAGSKRWKLSVLPVLFATMYFVLNV